jgi:hypothetical protein
MGPVPNERALLVAVEKYGLNFPRSNSEMHKLIDETLPLTPTKALLSCEWYYFFTASVDQSHLRSRRLIGAALVKNHIKMRELVISLFSSLVVRKSKFYAFHYWTGGSLTHIFPRQPATLFHLGRVPFRNFMDTWEPFLVSFLYLLLISAILQIFHQ